MSDRFLDIYDRYFDDIYRYVRFRVSNQWDADDIVSTVFSRAFERYSGLQGEAKPWLFAIARNAVIDHYRRQGREIPQCDLPERAAAAAPEDALVQSAEHDCLMLALRSLDEEQRELINLRYLADLRQRQIADLLAVSEAAVKMRLHRLLAQIREKVEQCLIQ